MLLGTALIDGVADGWLLKVGRSVSCELGEELGIELRLILLESWLVGTDDVWGDDQSDTEGFIEG